MEQTGKRFCLAMSLLPSAEYHMNSLSGSKPLSPRAFSAPQPLPPHFGPSRHLEPLGKYSHLLSLHSLKRALFVLDCVRQYRAGAAHRQLRGFHIHRRPRPLTATATARALPAWALIRVPRRSYSSSRRICS